MDQEKSASQDGEGRDGGTAGAVDGEARRREIERAVCDFQRGVDREGSFRFLFDTFYEPTRQFLARRVSSNEDRLDLTQETFLRVYRGLEGYRGDAQFGTWVFRIAFNTYLKWLRRMKTDGPGAETSAGADELEVAWDDDERIAVSPRESPLDRTLWRERRQALHQAVESLPEQMRRCTELRIYRDLSYREIAVVMRRSIETVKVHLFQARKKLRESFGDIDL